MANVTVFPTPISKVVNHLYKCKVEAIEIRKDDEGVRFTCHSGKHRAAQTLKHGQSITAFVRDFIHLLRRVGAPVEYKDA
jgi:hypothetical protein